MTIQLDELGEPTTFACVAERYADRSWLPWFLETEGLNDPETNGVVVPRIVKGDLRFDQTVTTGPGPWAVIVDGDLVTTGQLEVTTADYLVSTLIVTGEVRARNLQYATSARVGIDGPLTVRGVIAGTWGDAAATLGARSIEARAVLLDGNTSISFADAGGDLTIFVGSRAWREFTADVEVERDLDRDVELFVPQALERGVFAVDLAYAHAVAGHSPLLPHVETALRDAKRLPSVAALDALDTDARARELAAIALAALRDRPPPRRVRRLGPRELLDHDAIEAAAPPQVGVLADWLEQLGHSVPLSGLVRALQHRRR